MIWILIAILSCTVATAVTMPFTRKLLGEQHPRNADALIYQDQLHEVDRDFVIGTINSHEAQLAKAEIQRRLTQANSNLVPTTTFSNPARKVLLSLIAATLLIGSLGLYGLKGSPNYAPSAGDVDLAAMLVKLQDHLKTDPKNIEGWRMLGWTYYNTGQFAKSAEAYAKTVQLDPTNLDYKSSYVESLIQAAQGTITPEAQQQIAAILAKQPTHARARYYDASAHEQSGDNAGALQRWTSLLQDSPPDAPYRADVAAHIEALTHPNQDQAAMIENMVAQLAAKLEANPQDAAGWIKLMRSYQVLRKPDDARAALQKAKTIFAENAAKLSEIVTAATELGIK